MLTSSVVFRDGEGNAEGMNPVGAKKRAGQPIPFDRRESVQFLCLPSTKANHGPTRNDLTANVSILCRCACSPAAIDTMVSRQIIGRRKGTLMNLLNSYLFMKHCRTCLLSACRRLPTHWLSGISADQRLLNYPFPDL